ncbi:MAG: aspartate kinase [Candidatus Freyarchaeota archaeon]|nr:aspartate kinase [Candidatus Freyrarchaeum guaymaensis]
MVASDVIVVKFGGSCISSGADLRRAALMVKKVAAEGKRPVVVVSALKGVTDQLIKVADDATRGRVSPQEKDSIVSLGEVVSARVMAAALRSIGVDAVEVDPYSEYWPVFTDDVFGDANPVLELTRKAVDERIRPLLSMGVVPVVCGFLGLTVDGRVTTLGRGGSDTTAVLLGACLGASEVVLVKDVGGVLTGDPRVLKGYSKLDVLDARETFILASSGAKVIHAKALRFKPEEVNIRIVGFNEGDILAGGTLIVGACQPEVEVSAYEKPILAVTVIGERAASPEAFSKLMMAVREAKAELVSVALEPLSMTLYVSDGEANILEALHGKVMEEELGKALTCSSKLAMITLKGAGKVEGKEVSRILSEEGVGFHSILTLSSGVRIFVSWDEKDRVLQKIERIVNPVRRFER